MANSAYLMLTEMNTNITYNHIIDINENVASIDVSSYNPGVLFCIFSV